MFISNLKSRVCIQVIFTSAPPRLTNTPLEFDRRAFKLISFVILLTQLSEQILHTKCNFPDALPRTEREVNFRYFMNTKCRTIRTCIKKILYFLYFHTKSNLQIEMKNGLFPQLVMFVINFPFSSIPLLVLFSKNKICSRVIDNINTQK